MNRAIGRLGGARLFRWPLVMAVPAILGLAWDHAHAASGAGAHAKHWTWTFAADTLGKAPANTSIFGGRWEVGLAEAESTVALAAPDSAAGSPSAGADTLAGRARVLRQLESDDGEDWHYIRFQKPVIGDLVASVRFRILSGLGDPSAGLLFHLDKKGRSGYLVRVSGEKRRLIAHYVLYGKRRDLRFVDLEPPEPGTWHTIEVERQGETLAVRYDGTERFRIRDERYVKGNVGLWTEGDTVAEFADLNARMR